MPSQSSAAAGSAHEDGNYSINPCSSGSKHVQTFLHTFTYMAAYFPSSYSLVGTISQLGMTWSILGWHVPVPEDQWPLVWVCGTHALWIPMMTTCVLPLYVTAAYREHCPGSCCSSLINSSTCPTAVRPPALLLLWIILWVYSSLFRPPRLVNPKWHSVHFFVIWALVGKLVYTSSFSQLKYVWSWICRWGIGGSKSICTS